jgi:hypothetical protein
MSTTDYLKTDKSCYKYLVLQANGVREKKNKQIPWTATNCTHCG